jgi:hypothetical protein
LKRIPTGTAIAVFAMTLKREDVLIRGDSTDFQRPVLQQVGSVDIDWVYNSMPPCHGQLYPRYPIAPGY